MNRQERYAMRARGRGRQDQRQALASGSARAKRGIGPMSDIQPYQYRDEVGFRMTDEQFGEFQQKHADWESNLATRSSELNTAQGEVNTATKQLDAMKAEREKAIDDAKRRADEAAKVTMKDNWESSYNQGMSVRIVAPDNKTVEATYKVPKGEISSLQKELGGMGITSNYVDGGKNFNISVVGKSGIVGQELHDMFRTSYNDAKSSFYSENMDAYSKSRAEISKAYDQINTAKNELITSYQSELGTLKDAANQIQLGMNAVKDERNTYNQEISANKAAFEEKRDLRKALLGGQ